jgi:hypothetical protein
VRLEFLQQLSGSGAPSQPHNSPNHPDRLSPAPVSKQKLSPTFASTYSNSKYKKIGGKRFAPAATGIDFNRILLSA